MRLFIYSHIQESLRTPLYTDNKEHSQTRTSINRREGSISALISKYNKLVDEIVLLHKQGKTPLPGLIIPQKLEPKQVFCLDVDDDVWQDDPGLGDDPFTEVPRWFGNKNVHDGISALLNRDRCMEEKARLLSECSAMQVWLHEEHSRLSNAILHHKGDPTQS